MFAPSAWKVPPRIVKILLLACALMTTIWLFLSLQIRLMLNQASTTHNSKERPSSQRPSDTTKPLSKYAFATIITGEGDTETDVQDVYFTAARLLTYQLLHSNRTKSRSDIPFVVLVTEDVPAAQREILSSEGATVIPAANLAREWIHPKWSRWSNVLAKLHLWKLTEYEKITFMDADTIIVKPLDDIFTDPSTTMQETLTSSAGTQNDTLTTTSTPILPETYLISGIHDRWVEWALPPDPDRGFYVADNYLNAGFFVLSPSERLFDYYMHILDTPDAFDPSYPEQNLLNCAHRTDGRMPWRELGPGWNKKPLANERGDLANFRSLHQKWWRSVFDEEIDQYIGNVTQEMQGFYGGLHFGVQGIEG